MYIYTFIYKGSNDHIFKNNKKDTLPWYKP